MSLWHLGLVAEPNLPVFQFWPVNPLRLCAHGRVLIEFLASLQDAHGVYLSLVGLVRALKAAVNFDGVDAI